MEAWARQGYVGDSLEQGALQNANALGGIVVLDQIISDIETAASLEI